MNRTDRLLAIVLELQAKGWQRAADLAATFEVSKRTIYRDVLALCEAGVPVVSTPGRGYSLVEGYFLPPLRFSADEAIMLLLGSEVMAQSFDAEYRAAAESARRKIAGVLPDDMRQEVQSLQQRIRFIATGTIHVPGEAERLQQLRRAIIKRQTVRFHYYARYSDNHAAAPVVREADPYGLVHITNTWYLVAFCHLRQDIRHFRLDRMDQLVLTGATFDLSPEVPLQLHRKETRDIVIRALFEPEIARWVREARSFYTLAEEETAEGLLVTLRVRHEREVFQWLLSWGAHVRVLEPESLRQQLIEEAQEILRNHQQVGSLLT